MPAARPTREASRHCAYDRCPAQDTIARRVLPPLPCHTPDWSRAPRMAWARGSCTLSAVCTLGVLWGWKGSGASSHGARGGGGEADLAGAAAGTAGAVPVELASAASASTAVAAATASASATVGPRACCTGALALLLAAAAGCQGWAASGACCHAGRAASAGSSICCSSCRAAACCAAGSGRSSGAAWRAPWVTGACCGSGTGGSKDRAGEAGAGCAMPSHSHRPGTSAGGAAGSGGVDTPKEALGPDSGAEEAAWGGQGGPAAAGGSGGKAAALPAAGPAKGPAACCDVCWGGQIAAMLPRTVWDRVPARVLPVSCYGACRRPGTLEGSTETSGGLGGLGGSQTTGFEREAVGGGRFEAGLGCEWGVGQWLASLPETGRRQRGPSKSAPGQVQHGCAPAFHPGMHPAFSWTCF